MNTRQVLGRRIVWIGQSRVMTTGGMATTIDYIELENGVRLIPTAYETENSPVGNLVVNYRKRKTKATGGQP